jgi:hypothetical protein
MSLNCAVALRTLSIRGEGAFFQDEESCMPSLESCKDCSPAEASKGAPSVNETSARQRRMLRGALLPRANGASSSRRSGFCRESFIVVYLAGLYWRPVRRSRGSGIRARDGDESVEAKSTFEGGERLHSRVIATSRTNLPVSIGKRSPYMTDGRNWLAWSMDPAALECLAGTIMKATERIGLPLADPNDLHGFGVEESHRSSSGR